VSLNALLWFSLDAECTVFACIVCGRSLRSVRVAHGHDGRMGDLCSVVLHFQYDGVYFQLVKVVIAVKLTAM